MGFLTEGNLLKLLVSDSCFIIKFRLIDLILPKLAVKNI